MLVFNIANLGEQSKALVEQTAKMFIFMNRYDSLF